MVRLDMRLQHSGDPGALCAGRRDVVIDKIGVGVDHGELAGGIAAE
jgi:hypothetical protein